MDNKETILEALEGKYCISTSVIYHASVLCIVIAINVTSLLEFNRKPVDVIPPVLEQYLQGVATTGETT